ncbi:AzlD domain-containing protein (plasmid) [Vibrio europaeus]|uniref:AzlD domain-containing protein n=1 Tax=Vibrio europaeus TaxID=300876 RepID=A0AAE7AZW0_9VIBR|nr:AzlD domain-containing protein [Vibrio europaeus]QJY38014.1 AzlD domain-containing protein [Vibrio europaeus]
MTQSMIWVVLITSAIATFLLRYSFLWLNGKRPFPDVAAKWLTLIPPAAIIALIVPSLMTSVDSANIEGAPKLVAALLAVVIMGRTRSAGSALVVGMLALWLGQWLMGWHL